MVHFDPCERLKIIREQLIPSILQSAVNNTTSDIKTATEHNLPVLEKNCLMLLEKCEKEWPECKDEIELCSKENIRKVFDDTREKLKKIWIEREMRDKESEGGL